MKTPLSSSELEKLFSELIDNALVLFEAATKLLSTDQKHIALALSELALEEVGKSFTCLAYYSVADSIGDWKPFWDEWKAHGKKAHRAFLYEFFSTLRVELENKPDYFLSKRKTIPLEKEVSFYIDFDASSRKIITPKVAIESKEIIFRVSSVIGPINAASEVRGLLKGKSEEYKSAFSDYAMHAMTHDIYQQDALAVLRKMKKGTKEYDAAIDDIIQLFSVSPSI